MDRGSTGWKWTKMLPVQGRSPLKGLDTAGLEGDRSLGAMVMGRNPAGAGGDRLEGYPDPISCRAFKLH